MVGSLLALVVVSGVSGAGPAGQPASAAAGNGAGVGESLLTVSVIDAGDCDGSRMGGRGGVGRVVLGIAPTVLKAVADMV